MDRTIWGELESESEEEESEEEESEAEEAEEDQTGLVTPAEGLVTPSGMASIPTGLETPEIIELRKRKIENEMDGYVGKRFCSGFFLYVSTLLLNFFKFFFESGDTPAQLYQVLPEKRVDRVSGSMMASTHIYDMSNTSAPREGVPIVQPRGRVQLPGMSDQAVELALDPSELDLVDTEAMKARYEQQIREQSHLQKEDHSDMLADHLARQKVRSTPISVISLLLLRKSGLILKNQSCLSRIKEKDSKRKRKSQRRNTKSLNFNVEVWKCVSILGLTALLCKIMCSVMCHQNNKF